MEQHGSLKRLQRELNEALVTIADLLLQSCGDRDGLIHTHAISAYADAVDLLDRYGLIEHIGAAVGRVRLVKLRSRELHERALAMEDEDAKS